MLVRNKQSISHGGRQTITPICFLPPFPLSVCRFGPERRARPAAKASASTSPCRHGWRHTHARTHTEKHTSLACVFKHVRLVTCALGAPNKHILTFLRTHACVRDCHLLYRHVLFLKFYAHLHTFSHAWTHPPLPMSERPGAREHPARLQGREN